ncbi:Aste57867_4758 [Aphanomyces stellatus]|uniref:Aste57867_4758 protein n=1 Tax=Aphanomyces stellatus TaxID=120398 RepID=A0A485KH09_9STRA|nr:hypothetical protein As57867_004745 [Aphanomyces stellatus]VFT81854.1 Aste57867_4758 [Aphanomyces stellatus]
MDILSTAAKSVFYAFSTCLEPVTARMLRGHDGQEDEAPFLEMREAKSTAVPRGAPLRPVPTAVPHAFTNVDASKMDQAPAMYMDQSKGFHSPARTARPAFPQSSQTHLVTISV